MVKAEKKPLFIIYPDGYGTDKFRNIFSADELNATELPSTACISSTDEYEERIKKHLDSIHSRWKILEKV